MNDYDQGTLHSKLSTSTVQNSYKIKWFRILFFFVRVESLVIILPRSLTKLLSDTMSWPTDLFKTVKWNLFWSEKNYQATMLIRLLMSFLEITANQKSNRCVLKCSLLFYCWTLSCSGRFKEQDTYIINDPFSIVQCNTNSRSVYESSYKLGCDVIFFQMTS